MFTRQIYTDTEARKLQACGERMHIEADHGFLEEDTETMRQNGLKAFQDWSRRSTAIGPRYTSLE